jgi:patatin-like phospholipase/acyl hydrolase
LQSLKYIDYDNDFTFAGICKALHIKGKIERFNATVEEFFQEISLERAKSLEELNRKFRVWLDEGMKRLLDETFGDAKLKDAYSFLCIPAVEHNKAKPKVFRTPHSPWLHVDADISMVDVALSTAAAPTYLKAHTINGHDCKLDGGL